MRVVCVLCACCVRVVCVLCACCVRVVCVLCVFVNTVLDVNLSQTFQKMGDDIFFIDNIQKFILNSSRNFAEFAKNTFIPTTALL